jgi:glycosyltransferase 2 family protein
VNLQKSAIKIMQLAIGIGISAGAIILTVRRIDITEARQAFWEADFRWLIPAAILSVMSILIRAARWQTLFHPHRAPFGRVLGVFTVGQSITTLLPFRLGDFARAYLIGDLERRSKVWALSTIVVERLLDIAVLVGLFILLLPIVPIPSWAKSSVWIGGSAMLILLLALTVISMQRSRTTALARRWLRLVPQPWRQRLAALASPAVDGLSALSNPKVLLRALTWSTTAWVAGGLAMWSTLVAFRLPHSFPVAMLLLVMSAVAVALPSSPGFVGVYHAVVIESLVFVSDVSRSTAASYAVTTHILLFAPPVFIALGYLWREPQVWNRLLNMRRAPRQTKSNTRTFDEAIASAPASPD